MNEITCTICKKTKPVDQFYQHRNPHAGSYTVCKECCRARQNEYNRRNRNKSDGKGIAPVPENQTNAEFYKTPRSQLRAYEKINPHGSTSDFALWLRKPHAQPKNPAWAKLGAFYTTDTAKNIDRQSVRKVPETGLIPANARQVVFEAFDTTNATYMKLFILRRMVIRYEGMLWLATQMIVDPRKTWPLVTLIRHGVRKPLKPATQTVTTQDLRNKAVFAADNLPFGEPMIAD